MNTTEFAFSRNADDRNKEFKKSKMGIYFFAHLVEIFSGHETFYMYRFLI